MWLSLNEKRKDKQESGFPFLIPGYSFRVGSEVRQKQNVDGWGFEEKPVTYRWGNGDPDKTQDLSQIISPVRSQPASEPWLSYLSMDSQSLVYR